MWEMMICWTLYNITRCLWLKSQWRQCIVLSRSMGVWASEWMDGYRLQWRSRKPSHSFTPHVVVGLWLYKGREIGHCIRHIIHTPARRRWWSVQLSTRVVAANLTIYFSSFDANSYTSTIRPWKVLRPLFQLTKPTGPPTKPILSCGICRIRQVNTQLAWRTRRRWTEHRGVPSCRPAGRSVSCP